MNNTCRLRLDWIPEAYKVSIEDKNTTCLENNSASTPQLIKPAWKRIYKQNKELKKGNI